MRVFVALALLVATPAFARETAKSETMREICVQTYDHGKLVADACIDRPALEAPKLDKR